MFRAVAVNIICFEVTGSNTQRLHRHISLDPILNKGYSKGRARQKQAENGAFKLSTLAIRNSSRLAIALCQ
jgi:hypothetical protein